MTRFNAIQDLFDLVPTYFIPESANGVNASVQLDVTGDGGGQWYVKVTNGALLVEKGQLESPDLHIMTGVQDCLDVANGKLNPLLAYMRGKVNILGDTSKVFELQKLFRLPEELKWLQSLK